MRLRDEVLSNQVSLSSTHLLHLIFHCRFGGGRVEGPIRSDSMPGSGVGSSRKRRENRVAIQKEIQGKAASIVGKLEDSEPPHVDSDPPSEDPESDPTGVNVSPASSSVSAKENSAPRKKARSSVNRNLIMTYSPKKRKRPSSASSATRGTPTKQGRRGRPPSSRSSVVSEGRSTASDPVVESGREVEMRDDVSTSSDQRSTSSSTLRASRRSARVVREAVVEEGVGDVVEDDGDVKSERGSVVDGDAVVESPREADGKETTENATEAKDELEEESDDHSDSDSGREDSSDEENANEGVYVVERIDDKRVLEGVTYYFIKWKGWHESSNTWEPIENLDGCADLLKDFERRCAEKKTKKRATGGGGKGRKKEDGEDVDKGIAECQAHMRSYGIMNEWPPDKEPISVEGVIHVDNVLTYVVKRKVRLGSRKLDRSNAVLVHADSFKILYPHLVIDYYQSRVVWSSEPKTTEEQDYVTSQMALIAKSVGEGGVRKLVGRRVDIHEVEDDGTQVVERGDGRTQDDLEETDISSCVTSSSEMSGEGGGLGGKSGGFSDDDVEMVE